MRTFRALGIAAALVVVLAGCVSSEPHPVALSRAAKIALYEKSMDAAWAALTTTAPSAPRPDLTVHTVSAGSQWVLDIAGCLREQGAPSFTVTPDGQITLTGSDAGGNGAGAGPVLICEAEHPRAQDLEGFYSDSQLGALYDYEVNWLQPCLARRGVASSKAPRKSAFVHDYYTNGWTAYNGLVVRKSISATSFQQYFSELNAACPPLPFWLKG